MRRHTLVAAAASLSLAGLLPVAQAKDPLAKSYVKHCASCHGERLQGTADGPMLLGVELSHGDSVADIASSIADAALHDTPDRLDLETIRQAAIYVAEQRLQLPADPMMGAPLVVPSGIVVTERASFRIETVTTGIAPYAYSIAPLPDGRVLVTEKMRGLSIVAPDGTRSAPVEGTPETLEGGNVRWGLNYGSGWLLDVAPHPDYAANRWIYLAHTDLCSHCSRRKWFGLFQKTMLRLIRGRIDNGVWTDEQVIWRAPEYSYTAYPDLGAGGRIAFDDTGHVYLSVGTKGGDHKGIQDLSRPYGKVHRVRDDGRMPADNPFRDRDDALASIWTYGHRVPQGLEFDRARAVLWESEMGPRGGDEINRLEAGGNYGWPVRSAGLNYNGTLVDDRRGLDRDFDESQIREPVVDLTPAPSVSSFIVYAGDAFPGWQGDLLLGTLKARRLLRLRIEQGRHTGTEIVLDNLARIRDIEAGPDGTVYLLLEHASGSRIVRLTPS